MSASPYCDELMEWLGEVTDLESTGPGRFRLNRFEHRELAKPLSVQVTPESLAQYLEGTADQAREAFPEVEPQVAALRLLIVHLQEIFSRDGESAYIAITKDGLLAPWTRRDAPTSPSVTSILEGGRTAGPWTDRTAPTGVVFGARPRSAAKVPSTSEQGSTPASTRSR